MVASRCRCRPGCGGRVARASEVAGAALAPHVVELIRHGCTGDGSRARDELGLARPRADAGRAARALRLGRRRRDRARRGAGRVTRRRRLDADRDRSRPEAAAGPRCGAAFGGPLSRSTRSVSTRSSPISCAPVFDGGGPRRASRAASTCPTTGPAVIVSNRGFGVAEPAALGVAVQRASGRRLRVVGAPDVPVRRRARRAASVRSRAAVPTSRPRCAPATSSASRSRPPGCAPARATRRVAVAARDDASRRSFRSRCAPVGRFGGDRSDPWDVTLRADGHACPIRTTRAIRSRRRASPRRCGARSARCSLAETARRYRR